MNSSSVSLATEASSSAKSLKLNWVTIDVEETRRIFRLFQRDNPLACLCASLIKKKLGNTIIFQVGNSFHTPDKFFDASVQKAWESTIPEIYNSIMSCGFLVVDFVRSRHNNGEFVPHIISPEDCIVQLAVVAEYGTKVYRVLRPRNHFFNFSRSFKATMISEKMAEIYEYVQKKRRDFSSSQTNRYGAFLTTFLDNIMSSSMLFMPNFGKHAGWEYNIPQGYVLDRNCIVLGGFGADPSSDGKLNTTLASVLKEMKLSELHLSLLTIKETQACTNVMYFKREDESKQTSASILQANLANPDFLKGSYRKDPSDGKEEEFPRNEKELEEITEHLMRNHSLPFQKRGIYQDMPFTEFDHADGLYESAIATARRGVKPAIMLPPGIDIPKQQRTDPNAGNSYFRLQIGLEENISAVFGIPLEMVRPTSNHKVSEESKNLVRSTIQYYTKIISDVLTKLYVMIYGYGDESIPGIIADKLERAVDYNLIDQIESVAVQEWLKMDGLATTLKKDEKIPNDLLEKKYSDITALTDEELNAKDVFSTKKRRRRKRKRNYASSDDDNDQSTEKDVIQHARGGTTIQLASQKNKRIKDFIEKLRNHPEPVTVSVLLDTASSIDDDDYRKFYVEGCITWREYVEGRRESMNRRTTPSIYKELEERRKRNEEMHKGDFEAAKKQTLDDLDPKDVHIDKNSEGKSKSGDEKKISSAQERKRSKKNNKRKHTMTMTSSNEQRKLSASTSQKYNAKIGAKAGSKYRK